MLTFAPSLAGAQTGRVNQYAVTTPSLGFTNITGTQFVSAGDDNGGTFLMPFAFNYDNTTIAANSTVRGCTNGWIDFNGTQPYGSPYVDRVLNTTYNYTQSIYIMSADMYCVTGIFWAVSGSSPNRVVTVEFRGIQGLSNGTTLTDAQIKLYETTNVIEFLFKNPGTTMNRSYSGGLHGFSSPSFQWLRTYGPQTGVPSSGYRHTPPVLFDMRLALSPESINFGTASYGEFSSEFDVTVRNLGLKDNLLITGAVVSGTADFTVTSSPASNVVPPGGTAIYKFRFSPLAAFTRHGIFTVATNGLDSGTQSVDLTGFGLAPAVTFPENLILFRKTRTRMGQTITQAIPVMSTGNGPLTITGVDMEGEYASMYTWTRKLSGPIPPGVTDTIFVTFKALEEGLRSANVTIRTNAVQPFPNATYKMNGMGILPRLYMTPEIVRFDSTSMGDTAWTTLRLYNPGSDTLAVRADYVTYFDRDFTYFGLEGSDSLIYPETFRDVQVRFTPQMRGSRQGRVRFLTNIPLTFEDPSRDTSIYIVDVLGTSVPAGLLSIEGKSKTDSTIIGTQICEPVKLWNNGQSPLTVTSAMIVGANASDFALSRITLPATIQPGGFITAQLCGTPSDRGLRNATLEVSALSADKTTMSQLAIGVHGLAVCAAPSTNLAFDGEKVLVNTTTSAQIMVSNCGDVPAVYTAVINNGPYQITSPTTRATIAPGDNATFDVTFMPTVMGDAPGKMTISSTSLSDIVVDLAGIGGNVMIAAANTVAPITEVGETSAEFSVTVTNTGNMDLTPNTPAVGNTEFAYVAGSGPATIGAGMSGTFRFTFSPAAAGNRTASVSFPNASPALAGSFMLSGSTPMGSVRPVAMNGYALGQNYPNPFNPSTQIAFTMAEAGMAKIVVSDVTGSIVATVADGFFTMGANEVMFDASNLASGTYFYELIANGVRLQRSMLLNK